MPRFLVAIWLSLVAFFANIFTKSTPNLPVPVTTKRPTSMVRVTTRVVKEPSPLKRTSSAATSSTARTIPACRSRSPPSPLPPFPNISLSGIFATPLASDIELGRFSLASPPPQVSDVGSPTSPSPCRGSQLSSSSSFHSVHSMSPRTPASPVIVHIDRSMFSPTTMSDGSLQVISLGDPRAAVGSPVKPSPDILRLPSPWSPIGKIASSNVWMSVNGTLTNATGPVPHSQDDSATFDTILLSAPRIPSPSLYSSPSILGITVFADLDDQGNKTDTRDHSTSQSIVQELKTPRKRRDTVPSVTSNSTNHSTRAIKCRSTPLSHVEITRVRSATSISSMAYELRMGLFADGRSISAFENIISLLDQASPKSLTSNHDPTQTVLAA